MSNEVIRVEKLAKQYRLGEVSTGTIIHDLNKWVHRVRGKENPYLKIGEENDRTSKAEGDYVWALKDINFSVNKGDILGIIGMNGAGKSTLLKILSRTTSPTLGNISIKGRLASLLEVGTGFHPELTGLDNIFLNGAILGMRKAEIKRKLDEIIDFSGVEKYINTPVKRYSSGMYVRLAFAVAAHLESEILIVDEVLAVGDAEFQKKCLGKMSDVSKGEGKTVLFVSHDMSAITTLTERCICMQRGQIVIDSTTQNTLQYYLSNNQASKGVYQKAPLTGKPSITRVEVITSESNSVQANGKPMEVMVEINMPEVVEGMEVTVQLFDQREKAMVFAPLSYIEGERSFLDKPGINKLRCIFPSLNLYLGTYYVFVHLAERRGRSYFDGVDKICEFEVQMIGTTVEWGWRKDICSYTEDYDWETNN